MSFTVDNIVPPDQNFLGTSYGNLIPTWWNYIVALKTGTSPARFGMFLFLVGNVEGQDPPYPPQPKITVLKDVAVFFPTLCEVVSVSDHPDKNTEIKRREVLHDALQDPHLLKAEINGFELNGIGDFSKYYVESPEFELDVPQDSETLHSKFDPPMSPGTPDR